MSEESIYGSISGQNQVKQSCGIAPRLLLYDHFVGPLATLINVVCVDYILMFSLPRTRSASGVK